ncbi:hypothetical protein T08_11656 [Trichinella sp. T8]|nr:hypothetical protein T08_11656 [Trichinella sp. T8]
MFRYHRHTAKSLSPEAAIRATFVSERDTKQDK